jgi:sphingomyelin phosphodiesterase 2
MSQPTPTSSSAATKEKIRLLTLNVWGLALISKAKDVRIPAIAARLAASDYDIVALQEIWCESTDWRMLRDRCSAKFPYSKFFYS